MMQMLEAALREQNALRTELYQVPAYRKLLEVQKVIELYRSLETVGGPGEPIASARRRRGSGAAIAEAVVHEHLSRTGRRATSGQLIDLVREAGVRMPGASGIRNLSAVLSTSKLFDNLRGWGYGLAEWGGAVEAPPALVENQVEAANVSDLARFQASE
jgi:hypothetical protein